MEMIKAQLLRIQQQLAGLTATQKMLTASLVAIMLITLIWWTKSASTSDFEPVVSSAMSPDEASKVLGTLKAQGITEATITGGQVMVPSDRKSDAVAMLAYNDVMPTQANPADELLKLIGPFDSNQKIQMTKDASLEGRLAQAFMSYFPGVQKALVVLNTKDEHRIGSTADPSASVIITTKKGQANAKLLTAAITNIVSRAVSGLQPNKIGVVIDGKKQQSDSDDPYADDADTRVINLENHYTDQIKILVPPESMVLVKAELDDTTMRTETHAGNPETSVSKEKHSESINTESQTTSGASGDPGAVPNASVTIPGTSAAAQPQQSMTSEKTQSESEVYIGRTETQSEKVRGGAHLKSAAVRVPLSTFVNAYKGRHPGAKDPTDAELDPFIKTELDTLCKLVVKGLNLPSAEGVAMGVFYDAPAQTTPSVDLATIAPSSMVSGYGKQVMLGVLAAVSLLMVATMVKKGVPAPSIPIASPIVDRGPMTLNGLGELAGMVSDESSGPLDGVEVDEQQLKNHRVVEQVSAMVKEDPDAAAQLIKRWMSPT